MTIESPNSSGSGIAEKKFSLLHAKVDTNEDHKMKF